MSEDIAKIGEKTQKLFDLGDELRRRAEPWRVTSQVIDVVVDTLKGRQETVEVVDLAFSSLRKNVAADIRISEEELKLRETFARMIEKGIIKPMTPDPRCSWTCSCGAEYDDKGHRIYLPVVSLPKEFPTLARFFKREP